VHVLQAFLHTWAVVIEAGCAFAFICFACWAFFSTEELTEDEELESVLEMLESQGEPANECAPTAAAKALKEAA
jgi:hypothetical protein